ncbi:MAG TPA: hypothetical protein DDW85_01590 [Porphyromonadaceae bacterium]|nr:hypothetical protein [Porphyromonadaceae bacterium]
MDKELINTLKRDAIDKGLCRRWQLKFNSRMSYQELSEMYIKGIDFCICEGYPTIDFMRKNIRSKCEKYGIFIDSKDINLKNVPDIVLNGECRAELQYDGFSVSRIFIRHTAEATIVVSGHAYLTIDAFNFSRIKVKTIENARVLINQYGNSVSECEGDGIKINFKNKKTY